MKFPHLNLLFFIALLAFTSCEKEAIALPEPEPTEDASIGMRCCDQAVSDMLEDPRFIDFYDGFTTGVFDPILNIFDQYDADQLDAEFQAFTACIEAGNNTEYCIEQSEIISQIMDVLSSYDNALLISLLENYNYLEKEELTNVILEAVDQINGADSRKLTCFIQFESDMMDAGLNSLGSSGVLGGVGGLLNLVFGVVIARMKFCRCLYAKYGRGC